MTKETRERLLKLWERVPETCPTMTHGGFVMCRLCVRTPDQFHWDTGEPSHITFVRDEQAQALAVAKLVEWLAKRIGEVAIVHDDHGYPWAVGRTGETKPCGDTLLDALISTAESAGKDGRSEVS